MRLQRTWPSRVDNWTGLVWSVIGSELAFLAWLVHSHLCARTAHGLGLYQALRALLFEPHGSALIGFLLEFNLILAVSVWASRALARRAGARVSPWSFLAPALALLALSLAIQRLPFLFPPAQATLILDRAEQGYAERSATFVSRPISANEDHE